MAGAPHTHTPQSQEATRNVSQAIVLRCYPRLLLWMGDTRAAQLRKSYEVCPFLLRHPHTVTDYLLSHQLLPEALGRGELVAVLAVLPWILLWWLLEWLLVRSRDPSSGTGFFHYLSFPQRGLRVHLCVHSPGAFSPRITETHPPGQGPLASSLYPQTSWRPQRSSVGTSSGQWGKDRHH